MPGNVSMTAAAAAALVWCVLSAEPAGQSARETRRNINALSQRCQAGDIEACDALAVLSEDALRTAVAKIKEVSTLDRLATFGSNPIVGLAAVRRISDEALLAHVATSARVPDVALAAVGALTDANQLAEVARAMLVRFEIAKAAVDKLTDQSVLALVAAGSSYASNDVRLAAVQRLHDQRLLADVAKNAESKSAIVEPVRLAAVAKLTEQNLLGEVILSSRFKSEDHVWAALEKVTDQRVLGRIALEFPDPQARYPNRIDRLIDKVTDQTVLIDIAKSAAAMTVRLAAVGRLHDGAVLPGIARSDRDSPVRAAAVNKLTDLALLADLATTDRAVSVRVAAVGKLRDQSVLARIARSDREPSVKTAAASRFVDVPAADCRVSVDRLRGWMASARPAFATSIVVPELDPEKESAVRNHIDALAQRALRAIGLRISGDGSTADQTIRFTAFAEPSGTLRYVSRTDSRLAYTLAASTARLSFHDGADCVQGRRLSTEYGPIKTISSTSYTTAASAPMTEAIERAFAEAVVALTGDLLRDPGLGRLATGSGSQIVAELAIEKTTDRDVLTAVAKTGPDWLVREAATRRLATLTPAPR